MPPINREIRLVHCINNRVLEQLTGISDPFHLEPSAPPEPGCWNCPASGTVLTSADWQTAASTWTQVAPSPGPPAAASTLSGPSRSRSPAVQSLPLSPTGFGAKLLVSYKYVYNIPEPPVKGVSERAPDVPSPPCRVSPWTSGLFALILVRPISGQICSKITFSSCSEIKVTWQLC